MKERIITAIIFVIVMLIGIFGGSYTFAALILVIAGVSYTEFFRLAKYEGKTDLRQIFALLLGLSPVLIALYHQLTPSPPQHSFADYAVLTIPVIFLLFLLELHHKGKDPIKNLGTIFLGYFYIGVPYMMLVFLAFWHGVYQPFLVIGLLLLVWLNDTGAYFAGSFFGKHLLAPNISPKKTWEGLIGGVIATLLVSQILAYFIKDYSPKEWLIMGVLCSFGVVGDLIESLFKRRANIKDSGSFMPGHGGMLDRFDAFAFVIPAVFVYFYFFVRV